ncbi:MAG: phosphoglycerate kinase [Gammaproteobacteria bacterium]
MSLKLLSKIQLSNKRVMIREDFNVPLIDGKVSDDQRIHAALPTIEYVLKQGGKIILLSHLGRPKAGQPASEFSLAPVAQRLQELLNQPVHFAQDWLNGVDCDKHSITLCENVRFNAGETENDPQLAQRMAALCDVFVMDAFATAHRAHASTHGVAQFAKEACAGPLLQKEIAALAAVIENPRKPLVAIVAGSKVSTKLGVLKNLMTQVDTLIVGGGIANTLLYAAGYPVGKSLCETELKDTATSLLEFAQTNNIAIPLPTDVVVAPELSNNATATIKRIEEINADDMILDIGPDTAKYYSEVLQQAGTILWNGPVGVFEIEAFSRGTQMIAQAVAHSSAYSVAGGGDTLAAIAKFNVAEKISYISTGGGAFLEFIEGIELPAIAVLKEVN